MIRKRGIGWITALLLLSATLLGIATLSCSNSDDNSKLSIFAAAGAKPAMDKICGEFQAQRDTKVEIAYGGGGEMLSKMILTRSGDIYIAPEQRFMENAAAKEAIDPETVTTLAYMVPVIAVAKENPKQITSLTDLASEGVRVAVARPESTLLGEYAPAIFRKAGLDEAIEKNIVTYASDSSNLLNTLLMGQADAVIIWHFYQTLAGDQIKSVFLSPNQLTGIGQMQAAVSAYCEDDKSARKFIDFLTSDQGQAIFQEYGYFTDAQEVAKYWK